VESEIQTEVIPKRKGRPRLLTPEKIKKIRAAREENPDITQDQLAFKFGISRSLVRNALE
jgi:DNA-binding transcriptional regulator YiaG